MSFPLHDPLGLGPLWAALAEHTSDFVGVMTADGRALFMNRSVRGAPISDVEGKPLEAFLSPQRVSQIRHMLESVKSSGCPAVNAQLQVHAIDGTERWFVERLVPLHDPARGALFLLIRTETTHLRRTEEELRAFENRYQTLFDSNPDPVLVVGKDSQRVLEANPAAARLFAGPLVGQSYPGLFREAVPARVVSEDDEDVTGAMVQRQLANEAGTQVELLESPCLYGGASAYIVVMRDITRRVRLDEQLRHAQKMEAMGVFAAGVAHDFNNLLSIIAGFAANARAFLAPSSEGHEDLSHVLDATRRGAALTKKLMLFSRREIMRMEPLDLAEIIGDFGTIMRKVLGANTVLEVVQSDSSLLLIGDRTQIEQVILNLVINARQAIDPAVEGRVRVATRRVVVDGAFRLAHPWAEAPGVYAEVSVGDNGVGMSADLVGRVFEPFFTTKSDGTGLGLAVVHGIVKQHRGFIGVESSHGRGTTVRVLLPLDEAREAQAPLADEGRRDDGFGPTDGLLAGHERVLVAEDEPLLRRLTERSLTRLGYRVVTARDGEEALRMFEREPDDFDLVVLDVVMPKLSGREALLRMRERRPGLKAVFVTGYTPEATGVAGLLGQPGLDLLRKPFTAVDLAATVRRAFRLDN